VLRPDHRLSSLRSLYATYKRGSARTHPNSAQEIAPKSLASLVI